MRVVADTNTVVSGLLWTGAPRKVLDAARKGLIQLFTSAALLVELEDVLGRDKLAKRLALINISPPELVVGYAALATPVTPLTIAPVILEDPDDDAVLAVRSLLKLK
jgi:putative PIN family toxin of toxin-antitoxin system